MTDGKDGVSAKYQYIGAFAMDGKDDTSREQLHIFRTIQNLEKNWRY
ncbi:hypothetical protein [Paenibacillus macquariensis]|nr:hypothetical protein [Paenibacillus macquariensis]MEC0091770.1 hypothetical protein [Paenibacillus macquariensis]